MNPRRWVLMALLSLSSQALSAEDQRPVPSDPDACLKDDLCRAHYNLARELSKAGKLKEAIAAYEAAYYERQAVPVLLFNIARLYHRLGNHEQAINHYRRFLEADAPSETAQKARAQQYLLDALREHDRSARRAAPERHGTAREAEPKLPVAEPDSGHVADEPRSETRQPFGQRIVPLALPPSQTRTGTSNSTPEPAKEQATRQPDVPFSRPNSDRIGPSTLSHPPIDTNSNPIVTSVVGTDNAPSRRMVESEPARVNVLTNQGAPSVSPLTAPKRSGLSPREKLQIGIGAGVTGACGALALGTGISALWLDSNIKRTFFLGPDPPPAVLMMQQTTRTLTAVTDVAIAGAALALSVTLYFSLRRPSPVQALQPRSDARRTL